MSENHAEWAGPLPAVAGCICHICSPDESYDEMDRSVIETILKDGWQVIMVAGSDCDHPDHDDHDHDHDADESTPTFAYTIGLGHRLGHPELLMSGLDPHLMHRCLNGIVARIRDGLRLHPGDVLENVLMGAPVAVAPVTNHALAETVTWSGWFHRRTPEALAIVWPDRNGVFAWQPGGPAILDELQPPQWRAPFVHTGGLAIDPDWDFPVPADHQVFSCTHVIDDGAPILWAARQKDGVYGEDWSIHCGAATHATSEMRLVHLAHVVRSAPSLRDLAALAIEHEAWRDHVDAEWHLAPLADTSD